MGQYSKNDYSYGFVHTDMRPRNFHYINWKIIHFDFDDISKYWFIYDVAVSVFHYIENEVSVDERTQKAIEFLNIFLKWYTIERKITTDEAEIFVNLMCMRLIYAYIDYYKRLKIKNIDSGKDNMMRRGQLIHNIEDLVHAKAIKNVLSDFCKENNENTWPL